MTNSLPSSQSRRRFLQAAAIAPAGLTLAGTRRAPAQETDTFTYEVVRTDAEWRERLTENEYFVLRQSGTEVPHSSLHTFRDEPGVYACKGCDLAIFESEWKVLRMDIGWTFFSQARPTTILTSIDRTGSDMADATSAKIECHCRRCGSHFGHILNVDGPVLHCVNGTSFNFYAA